MVLILKFIIFSIQFISSLAKLRKATTGFVVCLSVRMEQLGSHWTDFH
jgi:hypothetical protein